MKIIFVKAGFEISWAIYDIVRKVQIDPKNAWKKYKKATWVLKIE